MYIYGMQWRKHISLFLIFSLLVSNLGYAFNVHYCDNKIASVSLNTLISSEQDCCGAVEQKSHCCKDRVVHIQMKSEQAITKSFSFNGVVFYIFNKWNPAVFTTDFPIQSKAITQYYCDSNAPPLFKLYSQYLFYDRF